MSNWNFRFFRRKRVAPGVVLNFSRSGISTTLGARRAKVTLGPRGIRQTIGLPVPGLYWTRQVPYGARQGVNSSGALQRGGGQNHGSSLVGVALFGFVKGVLLVALAVAVLAIVGAFWH